VLHPSPAQGAAKKGIISFRVGLADIVATTKACHAFTFKLPHLRIEPATKS
jgi:hypothetical protein